MNLIHRKKREALLYKGEEVTTTLVRALGELGVSQKPLISAMARALILVPNATIQDVRRLLDPRDTGLRNHVVGLRDLPEDLRVFWIKYEESRYYAKAQESVLNRFSEIFQAPLSTVLSTDSFRWEEVFATPKIVFINLAPLPDGPMRNTTAQLIMGSIQAAAKRTENVPEGVRIPYFMVIDEFDEFLAADESINKLFRLARKQRLGITIAHQTDDNVSPRLLGVIMGNVATIISLRISQKDAAPLAKELQLHVWEHDIPFDRVRQDRIQEAERYEKWLEHHNFMYARPGRTPMALPYTTEAEKAAHIDKDIQRIIDEAKGAINPAILQNLDVGHSITRVAGEH